MQATTHQQQQQQQELPIIDLLDDINDQMQIVLKSEPLSPKIDELESCLLNEQIDLQPADRLPSGNASNGQQTRQQNDGNSHNRQPVHQQQRGGTLNETIPFADLRWLTQNGNAQQPRPKIREASRTTQALDQEMKYSSRSISGTYCSFCQKTFSRAWSLQRHLADTHFYVPQSLSCDQCGRSYKSRNSLVSHKSQYHARKERKEHEEQCEVTY